VTGHGPFGLGIGAMMLFSVTAYGFFFLLPMYLQRLHGYTTFQSGMILLPGALFAGIATLASGALSDRLNPKRVSAVLLAGVVVACWLFSTDPDTPQLRLYLDYIVWGFFIGGCFAPITLLALSTVEERDISVGSTLVNMSRLIAGSIGTSYATMLLSVRKDTFYEALSNHFTWGSLGTAEMLARLQAMGYKATGLFQADDSTRLIALVKELMTLKASGYAFEATYQHLGLAAGVAIFFIILIPYTQKKLKAPIH
jgi:predicted MFS family arabinose efflux permease